MVWFVIVCAMYLQKHAKSCVSEDVAWKVVLEFCVYQLRDAADGGSSSSSSSWKLVTVLRTYFHPSPRINYLLNFFDALSGSELEDTTFEVDIDTLWIVFRRNVYF
jgi:hypothetical protein